MNQIVSIECKMSIADENNTFLLAEVENFDSYVTMHLWNKDTNEKTDVPVAFFRRLNPELFESISIEVINASSRKEFESYDPTASSSTLVRVNGHERLKEYDWDDYENDMILRIEDKDKSEKHNDYFTPYLLWMPLAHYEGPFLLSAPEGEGPGDEYSTESLTDRWALSLFGFPDLVIGVANWDDRVGIAHLIEMMDDIESLSVVAALTDSARTEKISTFDKSKEILATIEYPEGYRKLTKGILSRNSDLDGTLQRRIWETARPIYHLDKYASAYITTLTVDGGEFAYGIKDPNLLEKRIMLFNRNSKEEKYKKWLIKLEEVGLRAMSPAEIKSPEADYMWFTQLGVDEAIKLASLPIEKHWQNRQDEVREYYDSY